MRNKDTIEFLGLWERLNNSNFKPVEFDGFRKEAGLNRFQMSPQKWIEGVNAIGIISKSGRYGGTYGKEEIVMHFGQWLSPEFCLYLITEFKRLKRLETLRSSEQWQLQRELSKINYRVHTDAVDAHLIPPNTAKKIGFFTFANEADLINLAVFGQTAKEWKRKNPHLEGNMRDHAPLESLIVLQQVESMSSLLIEQGHSKQQRLEKLTNKARELYQRAIKGAESIKKLE